MADVQADIKDWSTTASSNSPTDATTVGAGLADNLQQIQATVANAFRHKGSDIASASTTNLGGTVGLYHDITGTTTITSFGTTAATGQWKMLQFDGALQITYNATSMILPNKGNITTAAGDMAMVIHEGSGNWRMLWYTKAYNGIITQNSQSGAYTTIASDAGKHILHPSSDNNARTFTIDSNANVPYPIGTSITFVNEVNTLTIAITSDTLTFASVGTTGSRTLSANGIATALKIGSTSWIISGVGLS
jgi:hypothetical protein